MKARLIAIAIVLGCSLAGTLMTSRLYWGYWLVLAGADWAVSSLGSTERVTIFCCNSPQSGNQALEEIAQEPWGIGMVGNAPVHNLPVALLRHGLRPATDEALGAELLS